MKLFNYRLSGVCVLLVAALALRPLQLARRERQRIAAEEIQ